jgi:hypothetical protein
MVTGPAVASGEAAFAFQEVSAYEKVAPGATAVSSYRVAAPSSVPSRLRVPFSVR